ncbi:MAG: response regulator [Thermodesulfobacteriota bacterium]|nr:response regulator [Thermodesulfobacteriota bacterium]
MLKDASILVIDDEAVIRDGCTRILQKEGCRVTTVENGKAGVDLINTEKEPFDILLLDLMMPGISGMEVLDTVRTIDDTMIVIVITGYATVESAVEAMKKGAYDFIAKPFTPDQLRIVVRRGAEKRSLQLETERLRREREKSLKDIAYEKSRISTIINCMVDGILVTDRESRIVLHNPAATRLLEIESVPLIDRPISECVGNKDLAKTVTAVLEIEESKYREISQEIIQGEGPGSVFLRADTSPVFDGEGEVMGSVTVVHDITQERQLNQMKSDFLAMVSHELRAPLSAIHQQLSVIQEGMAGSIAEKQKEMLVRAKERTQGTLDLITDLLNLSKIDSGIVIQSKETVSFQDIVEKACQLMEPEAEAKGIALNVHKKEPLPMIHADRESMEKVCINLISNAIKYNVEGGSVTIHLLPEGEFLRIDITDTGIGIPEQDLPRIFDRFYRAKSSKTRMVIGTGLGLPIVKGIIEAHHGSIKIQSKEEKGTTFTVLLPRTPD